METESRYRKLFNDALDMIHIVDREGRILDANPAELETLGYSREEMIGRPLPEIIHPEYRDRTSETLGRALRGETIRGYETALLTREGQTLFVEVNAVPELEGGEVLRVRAILRDITERKETAERERFLFEKIRESEQRLKEETEIISHLLSISQATAHVTDIHQMVESLGGRVRRFGRCDLFLFYLWDAAQKVLRPAYSEGISPEQISSWQTRTLDGKQPFFREILKSGEIRLWKSGEILEPDLPPFTWISEIRSFVWVPLRRKKEILGLLACGNREIRELAEREIRIWEGIGRQISIALEENRLYKESLDQAMSLSQQMETLRALQEIDRSILSARDPDEVLETAIRMVARILPCDFASITLTGSLAGEAGEGFRHIAGFGLPFLIKGTVIPREETTAMEVLRTARSQYSPNLPGAGGLPTHERRLVQEGFRSLLRMPLWAKGEVVGTLDLGSRRPSAFTPDNADTLEKLAGQVSVAMENARLVADLKELFNGTVKSLSRAIEDRSAWARGHSDRVVDLAVHIARELGLPEQEIADLRIAGWIHDIGMVGTYPGILDKKGGLAPEELAVLHAHPAEGASLLDSIRPLAHILPCIRSHHEWWNGAGYPDGLREEAIPLPARILAVADAFAAMTGRRPYRPTPEKDQAVIELQRCSGVQFDARVVEAFLRVVDNVI